MKKLNWEDKSNWVERLEIPSSQKLVAPEVNDLSSTFDDNVEEFNDRMITNAGSSKRVYFTGESLTSFKPF